MNSLIKHPNFVNEKIMTIYGKSTDTKPTHEFEGLPIYNGSVYYEMDTKKSYLYDEEDHAWLPQ